MSMLVCACACVCEYFLYNYKVYSLILGKVVVLGFINVIFFIEYATATGGDWVLVCNLAIFFGKLVTCTHYGATYWDNV